MTAAPVAPAIALDGRTDAMSDEEAALRRTVADLRGQMEALTYVPQARGKRRQPSKRTNFGACSQRCSGGNACVCDGRPHLFHTCSVIGCICHEPTVVYRPARTRRPPVTAMLDLFALMARIRAATPHRRGYPGRAGYTRA